MSKVYKLLPHLGVLAGGNALAYYLKIEKVLLSLQLTIDEREKEINSSGDKYRMKSFFFFAEKRTSFFAKFRNKKS
jgi:hypothetical protein